MSKNLAITLAWVGVLIAYIGNWMGYLLAGFIGITLALICSFFWALAKKRHWAFGIWGIIAPLGFLGIALLKDKSDANTANATNR